MDRVVQKMQKYRVIKLLFILVYKNYELKMYKIVNKIESGNCNENCD